jgi:hypothetical protein
LTFGDPIEDLSPKIGREEFYKNMIVKPINKKKEIIESNKNPFFKLLNV